MWKQLNTIGTIGSEDGIIVKDEQYREQCRITLEKCEKYYAITCGIYGAFVHTAFCDEEKSEIKYETMKQELQDFMDENKTEDEEDEFYNYFINKYL